MASFARKVYAMQTAAQLAQPEFVSVEDYLATETASDVRHEYLGGIVYAMAGETTIHNQICGNLYIAVRQHLRGKPCQVYMSEIRVNFELRGEEYFYYPDLVATCDKRDRDPRVVRFPRLIIEVLSDSTERVDRREKFLAFTSISTLQEYVLVGQDPRGITLFRRSNGWKSEVVVGAKSKVALASLKLSLPVGAIYEGI